MIALALLATPGLVLGPGRCSAPTMAAPATAAPPKADELPNMYRRRWQGEAHQTEAPKKMTLSKQEEIVDDASACLILDERDLAGAPPQLEREVCGPVSFDSTDDMVRTGFLE